MRFNASPLLSILGIAALIAAAGCGGDPVTPTPPPPTVASVQVTSPIDTILAVTRTAQLAGSPRDAAGNALAVTLAWATSNSAVATVSGSGLVTGLAAGTVTITATPQGSSTSGTLRLKVVPANLAGVTTLTGDLFAASLVNGLTTTRKVAAQPAVAVCASAATSGNVVAIIGCIASIRVETGSATDPTDRVLLASLALYIDQIERFLGL